MERDELMTFVEALKYLGTYLDILANFSPSSELSDVQGLGGH